MIGIAARIRLRTTSGCLVGGEYASSDSTLNGNAVQSASIKIPLAVLVCLTAIENVSIILFKILYFGGLIMFFLFDPCILCCSLSYSSPLGAAYFPDGGALADGERRENENDIFVSSYLLRPKLVRVGGETAVAGVEVGMVACCGKVGTAVVEPDWGRGSFREDDGLCDVLETPVGAIAL